MKPRQRCIVELGFPPGQLLAARVLERGIGGLSRVGGLFGTARHPPRNVTDGSRLPLTTGTAPIP